MRKETKVMRETTTFEDTCDFCGLDVGHCEKGISTVNEVSTRIHCVKIEHREGKSWSSADYDIDDLRIDMCGLCFKEKVLPELRKLGFKTEYENHF